MLAYRNYTNTVIFSTVKCTSDGQNYYSSGTGVARKRNVCVTVTRIHKPNIELSTID